MTKPWTVQFSRPSGDLLESTTLACRDGVVSHLQVRVPWMEANLVGGYVLKLYSPEGDVYEGEAALEGTVITSVWLEGSALPQEEKP